MKEKQKQGNQSGSETRQKCASITFRASPEERAEIEAAADAANLTLGSYIRDTVLKRAETRKTKRPSIDRQLMGQALGLLGKVGNNLNQIARRLNEGKGVGAERVNSAVDEFLFLRETIIKAIGGLCDNQGQKPSSRCQAGTVSNEERQK